MAINIRPRSYFNQGFFLHHILKLSGSTVIPLEARLVIPSMISSIVCVLSHIPLLCTCLGLVDFETSS